MQSLKIMSTYEHNMCVENRYLVAECSSRY